MIILSKIEHISERIMKKSSYITKNLGPFYRIKNQTSKLNMKTFALGLLASSVIGIKVSEHAEGFGYTVAPGETVDLTLEENPSTGYAWQHDETLVNGLYEVESSYQQDKSCKDGVVGCGGLRTFKITAGPEEGDGTFYACYTQPWISGPVRRYSNQITNGCKEIPIHVERESHFDLRE